MSESLPPPFQKCTQCGAELPADGTNGLCPACLMAEAMQPTGSKTPAAPWQPPSADELQAMLPQYEIMRLLGRGGMGAVYQGRQISLDRLVAIKILSNDLEASDASFAERFKNEARAMAKLSHPGIVAVHDFGETPSGLLFIVMEFVEGTDVQKMIQSNKRLHTEHAMAVAAHVCDALHYAHERGIIHRDIKPANIMVGYDGVVKVADFGLAKIHAGGGETLGLTQSGMAMGTLHYMAPEALMLGTAVDRRADVYAVGVMLYHMLTGKLPQGMFELPSIQVAGLDPRYDGIIAKALREDRILRYATTADMRADLDSILTRPVVKADPEAPAAAAAAPALPTAARPQRPAGQPYRPPQPQVIVRTEKKGLPLLWAALIAMCAVAGWLFFKGGDDLQSQTPTSVSPTSTAPAPVASANTPSPASSTSDPVAATKDKPFVNSLGMKFVPVPGTKVLMCIHETRYRDYATHAADSHAGHGAWKDQNLEGVAIAERSEDHPVVNVDWNDAQRFCSWLSGKEPGLTYRLPTDLEWSFGVGLDRFKHDDGTTPVVRYPKDPSVYPWDGGFPPRNSDKAGNYADAVWHEKHPEKPGIEGYTDGYPTTAPVMSFQPNKLGLYDMGGNVWEWCEDWFDDAQTERVLRGASWDYPDQHILLSSYRARNVPRGRFHNRGFRVVVEDTDRTMREE